MCFERWGLGSGLRIRLTGSAEQLRHVCQGRDEVCRREHDWSFRVSLTHFTVTATICPYRSQQTASSAPPTLAGSSRSARWPRSWTSTRRRRATTSLSTSMRRLEASSRESYTLCFLRSRSLPSPFAYPDYVWDFKIPRVHSINASGHKYGMSESAFPAGRTALSLC